MRWRVANLSQVRSQLFSSVVGVLLTEVGRSLIGEAVLSGSPLMSVVRVPVLRLSGAAAIATSLTHLRVVTSILREVVLGDSILVHAERPYIITQFIAIITVEVSFIVIKRLPLTAKSSLASLH